MVKMEWFYFEYQSQAVLVNNGASHYSVPRKGQDSWIPLILFLSLAFLGILEIYIFFLDHKAVTGLQPNTCHWSPDSS